MRTVLSIRRMHHRATLMLFFVLSACNEGSPGPSPTPPPAQPDQSPAPEPSSRPPQEPNDSTIVVATPSRAGAVEGTTENSDAFIWRIFTEFVAPHAPGIPSPVVFETWASDKDTFSTNPRWPSPGEPLKLRASLLARAKGEGLGVTSSSLLALTAIDEKCKAPPGAAAGGFPDKALGHAAADVPCIAEQVGRNREEFDYIVGNQLNTKAGLAAAFASGIEVEMPIKSIAVKGDWVPVQWLLAWLPQLGDTSAIRRSYYMATVDHVDYALVSLHVSSRQNPNWVWGTFEHRMNPGRCDYIGCIDSFGTKTPLVRPNLTEPNTQYGVCEKTPALKELMKKAGDSPVWENYCLKGTQVDYTALDGTPYALGNSVIEGIVGNGTVAASSCISCHAYASFGDAGSPTRAAAAILPFNPLGRPIPGVLAESKTFAFNWGLLLAP